MRLVREQLAAFRGEMERDGAAQRGQARRLIAGAAQRAAQLVDSTLQARSPRRALHAPCASRASPHLVHLVHGHVV